MTTASAQSIEVHPEAGDVGVQPRAMFTVRLEVARPRFEIAVLPLEHLHLFEQPRVLVLNRQIRGAVCLRFDSGMSDRDDEVVDRRGCILDRCTLVRDGFLEAVKITVPETPHTSRVRVDEAAERAIEQFLTS